MTLPVTKIQRFSTHDGPGLRTTVFLRGCPLQCHWCHNPETWSSSRPLYYTPSLCLGCRACQAHCPRGIFWGEPVDPSLCQGCLHCVDHCPTGAVELVFQTMTPQEIFEVVRRDLPFYGQEGGLTLSGGEPLIHPQGCLELLALAKEAGMSTVIETSGFFDGAIIPELSDLTDLFLWDFKESNPQRHLQMTGVSPERILENLMLLDQEETQILLRCLLIRGVNMEEDHYQAIARTVEGLRHCIGVELLPYHPYGGGKSQQLGWGDWGRREWVPTPQEVWEVASRLGQLGVKIVRYGEGSR